MNRACGFAAAVAALFVGSSAAFALDCSALGYAQGLGGYYKATDHSGPYALDSNCNPMLFGGSLSATSTNPISRLAMTSATAAYSAGQLIATDAAANSIVNPSFTIPASGGATIPLVRLSTNDTTTTAWGRAAWSPASATGAHLASRACTMSDEYGDGAFAECGLIVGSLPVIKVGGGSKYFLVA